MGKFAVIDTETNWGDQVMSIGTVIADEASLCLTQAVCQQIDAGIRLK